MVPSFCRFLAGSRINLQFLTTENRPTGAVLAGCVTTGDCTRLKPLINKDATLAGRVEYTQSVGLLTLFPHRSSLAMFGRSLDILLRAGIKVFAMASSIGALTYVVDYNRIDKAAAILKKKFNLDDNHAPFRAEFTVAQGTEPRPGSGGR